MGAKVSKAKKTKTTSAKRENARESKAIVRAREARMVPVVEALVMMRREQCKPIILKVLSRVGTLSAAARAARVTVGEITQWAEQDPVFAAQLVEAHDTMIDSVEQTAFAMAMSGSERMIEMLLKANRRDKYGDKVQVESKVQVEQKWVVGDREIVF